MEGEMIVAGASALMVAVESRHLGGEIHRTYPQCMSEMSKDVR